MKSFRFLHAGDLHLDSPLIGLSERSREVAQRIDDASRRAFNGLITLAIEEECSFVLFPGDLFDGSWRDYRTGLFFMDGMHKLRVANIPAFIILGNHDAENKFVSRLKFADNEYVHLFSSRKAETKRLQDIGVSIHGRSFPQRNVVDNLALTYPPPTSGDFNIGLLHTACGGRGDESYAPCTVEQLANHGYDYWALGHVHEFEILRTAPHIVYSGNLQGRQPRENGPKGAVIVKVEQSAVATVESRALDAVRWSTIDVDVSNAADIPDVTEVTTAALKEEVDSVGTRSLVARVRLLGQTSLHSEILKRASDVREEIQTAAAGLSPDLWIERIVIGTSTPQKTFALDPTVEGQMNCTVRSLAEDSSFSTALESKLSELKSKIPAGARPDELLSSIRNDIAQRALNVALSNINSTEEGVR